MTGAPRKPPRRATSKPTGEAAQKDAQKSAREQDAPVIPDQTADDTDAGGGDWREAATEDDERYLRERPPHW